MSETAAPPFASADQVPEPIGWQAWAMRFVLRLGLGWSVAALTAVVTVAALVISQLLISLLGEGNRLIAALSSSLCSLLLTPLIGAVVLRLVIELEKVRRQLNVLATQDDLTGVHNRRHFMSMVEREWQLARRHRLAAAMLLIDADHFKLVNDTHGHLCGDHLLCEIARAVRESLRQADVLGRFGGEELIVFLPHTDPLGALDVAERIRERVQALSVAWNGSSVGTTVSIGVAPLRFELPSLDWMVHESDTALYAAKSAGRNCVRTLPFQPSASGAAYSFDAG